MYSVEKKELGQAVSLLAADHEENPRIIVEMEGVSEAAKLLEIQAKTELEELHGKGEIWMLEGEKGLLIAYYSKRLTFLQYLKMVRQAANSVNKAAGKENLKIMAKNEKKLKKITNPGWAEKNSKGNGYYRLLHLYIPPKHRRKGLGTEMITPLLEFCDERQIPIAAEVYSEEGVAFLETFGFETFKILADKNVELKCYEMVRPLPPKQL